MGRHGNAAYLPVEIRPVGKNGFPVIIEINKFINHFMSQSIAVLIRNIEVRVAEVCPYKVIGHIIVIRDIRHFLVPVRSGLVHRHRVAGNQKPFVVRTVFLHDAHARFGNRRNLTARRRQGRNDGTGIV